MYLDLIPPPEVHFGGEPCGVFREQDECFCLFFCGSGGIFKVWLLLASPGRGRMFSGLSALRGGVSRSSKQTRSLHK